jgi:hypothetical protein
MFKLLIDTCVWLDLAKDYQQQAILAALEELVRQADITLILPRIIVDEFARNKARIIEDSSRSLSGTLKRAKEAVEKFGDPRQKRSVLHELDDVNHRLLTLGEAAAVDTVGRIEKLFAGSEIIEISRCSENARSAARHRQASAFSSAAECHRRCDSDRGLCGCSVRQSKGGYQVRFPSRTIRRISASRTPATSCRTLTSRVIFRASGRFTSSTWVKRCGGLNRRNSPIS